MDALRRMTAEGTEVLAAEYGVSPQTLWCAIRRKTWRHVQ